MRVKLLLTILIVTAAALVATAMPARAAEPTLIGYWKMNDNTSNNTVAATVGTNGGFYQSAYPSDIPDNTSNHNTIRPDGGGNALGFDGINDLARVADSGGTYSPKHITVSAWVRLDSFNDNRNNSGLYYDSPIMSKDDVGTQRSWGLMAERTASDLPSFGIFVGGYSYPTYFYHVEASSPLTVGVNGGDGVWTHLVGTYDGETLKLYVNGAIAATDTTPSGDLWGNVSNLFIGSYTGGCHWLDGGLDELGIWDDALSETDVQRLYTTYGGNIGQFEGLSPNGGDTPEPATMAGVAGLIAMAWRKIRRNRRATKQLGN